MKYSFKKSVLLGLLIGGSIMIPGLGPSTVMIYTNSYNDIINSISNLRKDFKSNFKFLLPILLFALIGFILGLLLVKVVIEYAPLYWLYAFAGIMIATLPDVIKEKPMKFNFKTSIFSILGIIFPFVLIIGMNSAVSIGEITYAWSDYLIMILVGILVALTQLVPGMSATILLMSLGLFTFLLDGLSFDSITNPKLILLYIALIGGVLIGVILFTKLISYLLKKYPYVMHCVTVGMSIASIFLLLFFNDIIIYPQLKWWELTMALGILLISGGLVYLTKYFMNKKKLKDAN